MGSGDPATLVGRLAGELWVNARKQGHLPSATSALDGKSLIVGHSAGICCSAAKRATPNTGLDADFGNVTGNGVE